MSDSDLLDSNDLQYDSEDDYGYGSDDIEVDAAAGEPRATSAAQEARYTVISSERLQALQVRRTAHVAIPRTPLSYLH